MRERGSESSKKRSCDTHKDGKRVRYFEDDEKYTLKQMFEREQMRSVADENMEFVRLMTKNRASADNELEDMHMEQNMFSKTAKDNSFQNAVNEHQKTEKALDNCTWCLDSKKYKQHLIISTGSKCYLCLPYFQSLTEGHCLIVPTYHATCGTLLDEDIWEEILQFCASLVNMFRENDQDTIFFETAMNFRSYPHMVLNCVPVPYESGNLAPIYFKKAISECEKEWSDNKKLVNMKKLDIKRAVPKGLPYFMVNFGLDDGFAHVIEHEKQFPTNFAQEIIGGMLDLDHRIWRKRRVDDFETQCRKVNDFTKMWTEYDFTKHE